MRISGAILSLLGFTLCWAVWEVGPPIAADAVPPSATSDTKLPANDSLVPAIKLVQPDDLHHHSRAHAHPHGDKVCASGCALSRHPTERLTDEALCDILAKFADAEQHQNAIDELIYYGPQAALRLRDLKADAIPEQLHKTLLKELSRRKASVSLRLVSADGRLLADLPGTVVPLDLRHEFDMREHGIPTLLASGTVKRVGEYKLWSRL